MSTEKDILAEIDGIKPNKVLADGEEFEARSKSSSKTTYKLKRTWDHYYCTCPAWRMQSKKPVSARSCKHLREVLGDAYEDARLKQAETLLPDEQKSQPSKEKPKSTSKAAAKPKSKTGSTATKTTRGSKRKREAEEEDEDEKVEESKEEEPPATVAEPEPPAIQAANEPEAEAATGGGPEDVLAEINGIKPLKYLADGEETEAKSHTSSSVYKIKRTWDHFYCTCPAWRNQARAPTNARTCKHLKTVLGEAYENARIARADPNGAETAAAAGPSSPSKGRKKAKVDSKDEKKTFDVLLANKWDIESGPDPTGWWASEKLDGVRAVFDGEQFYSRTGNKFFAPKEFLDLFPKDVTLDGELYSGRQNFQDTVSIVRTSNSPKWSLISFHIFDIPSHGTKPFEERLKLLEDLFQDKEKTGQVKVVEHTAVTSRDHVLEMLKDVETKGGEGLMLRKPGSTYEHGRSSTLLKIKSFYDAEAKVLGYEPGKGKNKGVMGALKCVMASGKKFNVGTGFSDKQRRDPPKIGSIITYRFQELTRDNVPRFPSYVGEAIDKDEPTDAEVPDHRKGDAKTGDDV
ncbi:DNA ligase/mRNA capping enzyme [Sistotremastrum suecicum HHB10207 ss-3]|uniref:DNA ligase/mRNA capping enzyme n=1 Tax=Sistotremastrum suecicum HHB10207 ss-3 TaxID=1314776 RepID=A0A166FGK7_9AGAM|nr:DNA ligase/mRNA capping enzyme [Sistotremastrum suecicum HHB10207 ss-3]